jgi:ABC-2 type transport system ATP-binding protein
LNHDAERLSQDAPAGTIATVRDLCVAYAGEDGPVLNGLNFDIRRGEIFGLLGPNGAGKTTLIRAFCGRVRPTTGELAVAGTPPQARGYHRRIGLAPQDIALFSHLTARENLEVFARMAGLRGSLLRERVDRTMVATHINDHHKAPVSSLSGGWKRRVNIAAAMIHVPDLLILDEPTVGVDVATQAALETVIREFAQSGRAVLITTHDMEQAERLCDRIGLLVGGRFTRLGKPAELLDSQYAGRKILAMRLATAPAADVEKKLVDAGFDQREPTIWLRVLTNSADAEIDTIRALDLPIREISLRQPSLDYLINDVIAEEMAA